jgi:hypothetical protein
MTDELRQDVDYLRAWVARLQEEILLLQPSSATKRETLALGWLSAELADRAGAWKGNAPEWFPEPPEWLELWDRALKATEAEAVPA